MIKLKRTLKKNAFAERVRISEQNDRFLDFFRETCKTEKWDIVSYTETLAFTKRLKKGTKESICKFNINDDYTFELDKCKINELCQKLLYQDENDVLIFSNYDYCFPSVIMNIEAFFINFNEVMDLFENDLMVIFEDLETALTINNENENVLISVFGKGIKHLNSMMDLAK